MNFLKEITLLLFLKGKNSFFYSKKRILFLSAIKSFFCSTWNYLDKGPDFWFSLTSPANSGTCGSGQNQSPINIIPSTSYYNSKLTDITFNGYSTNLNWNIEYDGHSGSYLYKFIIFN